MVRFVCGCLNVKIHAKSMGHPVDPSTLDFQRKPSKNFFDQELQEVTLNLEGIHVEHVLLITKDVCDPWVVHRCNNCKMLTHAIHQNPDAGRVLVSPGLQNDEQMIERMTICPDYSPLYKVVVKATAENLPVAIDWIPKEVTETLQMLQLTLNSFLVTEEQAMEERIREFQEQERERYAKMQTKAKNDKNSIISTILINVYNNVSESLLEAMSESPVGSQNPDGERQDAMTSVSPLTFGKFLENGSPVIQSPLSPPLSKSESNQSRKQTARTPRKKNELQQGGFAMDADDVFQYDPGCQDDPAQLPFSESDDEDPQDTDDSSGAEDATEPEKGNDTKAFSTSMPIAVPQWGRQISRIEFDDDDVDAAPKDAESMAASIQALARSIHGDSSNVFGELPTSRTRARVLSSQTSYHH